MVTLDPIHVDTIAHLASAIAEGVDDSQHEELAETVWREWLDPLRTEGRTVLEPVDDHRLRAVNTESIALADRPFDTTHGLDSGTLNPTSFKNGLVLDVAQAAMAADPSNLDLHRARSVVATVHTNDATVTFPTGWTRYDGGHSQRRILQVPRTRRYTDETVHELALYLAESKHALDHANTVPDLLVLDGPLYPKRLLNWATRDRELKRLARGVEAQEVVENYVELVERFVRRDVPLVGFIKNPTSGYITRTLDEEGMNVPWPDDTALFTRLLEPESEGERDTTRLTFTSWFVSRGGSDEPLSAEGNALGVERKLNSSAYEVTFFMIYDPREDLLYRVEAPIAFTSDLETRRALTTQLLSEVAAERGPPAAVAKADELARISREEKKSLRHKFEEQFDSESLRTYDEMRWPGQE